MVWEDGKAYSVPDGGEGVRSLFTSPSSFTTSCATATSSSSSSGVTKPWSDCTAEHATPSILPYSTLLSKLSSESYSPSPSPSKRSFNALTSPSKISVETGLSYLTSLLTSFAPSSLPPASQLMSLLTPCPSGHPLYLSWWSTLYNLVVKCNAIHFGVPSTTLSRLRYFDAVGVTLSFDGVDRTLTLNQIENGLLRMNRPAPYHISPSLSSKQSSTLQKYQAKTVDRRLHATLNCGAVSCPPVMGYGGDADVEVAWRAFREENVRVLSEEEVRSGGAGVLEG